MRNKRIAASTTEVKNKVIEPNIIIIYKAYTKIVCCIGGNIGLIGKEKKKRLRLFFFFYKIVCV